MSRDNGSKRWRHSWQAHHRALKQWLALNIAKQSATKWRNCSNKSETVGVDRSTIVYFILVRWNSWRTRCSHKTSYSWTKSILKAQTYTDNPNRLKVGSVWKQKQWLLFYPEDVSGWSRQMQTRPNPISLLRRDSHRALWLGSRSVASWKSLRPP